MDKFLSFLLPLFLIGILSACTTNKDEKEIETPIENVEQSIDDSDVIIGNETENEDETSSDDKVQKEMALDVLAGIFEDAKTGKVYRLSDGIYIGKTTRKEVIEMIGEPEEKDTFDHYHGSMGNASYDLAYNEKGILKEARYFGTNVERQTNLGGITTKDLIENIGEPDQKREMNSTNETNYIYQVGDFELQFIMQEDGTTDHVNLK
ncbi:DUF4309 domain-containing protein [Sporosarcina koreensis]|uniref:DUF4309 domain-containing protein n=1 Tax=Sporosarcina koreensis TaxID=334735 RepID=A0ABW0TWT8_9BACL